MSTQGISQQMDIAQILVLDELVHELLKASYRGMQQIQIEKWKDGHDHPEPLISEMVNDAPEIAHGAKQPVEQQECFTLPLFYISELTFLFDRIIH